MVGSWIFKQNLESFLEMLAWIAGHPFADWDYNAIVAGIEGTNGEKEQWFHYELDSSKRRLAFHIADDPGSSVYLFRISAPDDVVPLVELAYFVAEGNDLKRHGSFEK